MKSLILIARLLDYPEAEIWENKPEILRALLLYPELEPSHITKLSMIIEQMLNQPLLTAQADYGDIFDRGRSVSLLLFEHVHGESRERGQAMIDLLAQYEQSGIQLKVKELPDHLPAYLEYLSILPKEEAVVGLCDVAHILALVKERLIQRESHYAALFEVLVELSQRQIDPQLLSEKVAQETKDYTPEALDAVWEEEQVTFLGEKECASAQQAIYQQQMTHQQQIATQQQIAHQRRFVHSVIPQYLNIDLLSGVQK